MRVGSRTQSRSRYNPPPSSSMPRVKVDFPSGQLRGIRVIALLSLHLNARKK